MAQKVTYIQCFRVHEKYKNDWPRFVSAFKKQFSSEKTAYHAQVEPQGK